MVLLDEEILRDAETHGNALEDLLQALVVFGESSLHDGLELWQELRVWPDVWKLGVFSAAHVVGFLWMSACEPQAGEDLKYFDVSEFGRLVHAFFETTDSRDRFLTHVAISSVRIRALGVRCRLLLSLGQAEKATRL
jgi:hypothetical protein